MFKTFKIILLVVLVLQTVTVIEGQSFSRTRTGSCPPPLLVSGCDSSCSFDNQCPGVTKCCRTACGGAVCTIPVTSGSLENRQRKAGSCPADPKGPWVCSSRCGVDTDCRRRQKCCRNKCGALACMNPE